VERRPDRSAVTAHLDPDGGTTNHPALAVTQTATAGTGSGATITTENTATPALDVAGGTGLEIRATRADRAPRITVGSDGSVTWGSGSSTGDVTLTRTAEGVMVLSGALTTTGDQAVIKDAAETINNVDVLQDDDELVVSVAAGAVYSVEIRLLYSAAAAADLQVSVTGPAGATLPLIVEALPAGASAVTDAHIVQIGALGDAAVLTIGAVAAGTQVVAQAHGLLTTAAAAGSLQVRWAQATANVSDAVVDAGSWIRVTRIS
jgi:hypothetical protein